MSKLLSLLAPLVIVLALGWYGFSFTFPEEPTLPGKLTTLRLDVDGVQRSSLVYTPAALTEGAPLILVFHGSAGDGQMARMLYGYRWEALAEREGFVVAFPDGFEGHFNGCRKKGPYSANELDIDDIAFMRKLINTLHRHMAINSDAVIATGVSNGGQMALRLALEAPELIRLAAPIATSMPVPENMGCEPSGRPANVLLMNGTDDPMNPFAGGKVALYGLVGDRGDVLSSADSARYWAALGGLPKRPERSYLADRFLGDDSKIQVERWVAPGKPKVAHYIVHGGGHNAPHPDMRLPRVFGGTNRDYAAADLIWAFHKKLPIEP
ncbi:MAG: polyhydroxybutyrate depolymerase [Pseudomonadota bacterium]